MKTLTKSIEFWEPEALFEPDVYEVTDKDKRSLDQYSEAEIRELIEHLCSFNKARKALHHLRSYFDNNREILRAFCRCNFSALDNVMDITPDRLNFEIVKCEFKGRGSCPYQGEGKVCIK